MSVAAGQWQNSTFHPGGADLQDLRAFSVCLEHRAVHGPNPPPLDKKLEFLGLKAMHKGRTRLLLQLLHLELSQWVKKSIPHIQS